MNYKNYIFDLYGTLIDIHTDEKNPKLWEFMSEYLKNHFETEIDPERLKQEYSKLCKLEEKKLAKENGSKHPEIKIEWVWEKLIGRTVSDVEMRELCNTFRYTSRDKFELYDGVVELLTGIRAAGGRIYLLSNAQRLFTEKELEDTDIAKYFDDIFISSDKGIKKPEMEFLQELIDKHSLNKEECVMVGNEVLADVGVAAAVGIDAIFINSYNHSDWDIKRDLKRSGANMDRVKMIPDISQMKYYIAEIWDAYNRDFSKIEGESLVRGQHIPDNVYHLVCDVVVKHLDGTYLIMQRDYDKTHGGKWELTAGGSALQGEDPEEAALRELSEETGISGTIREIGRTVQDKNHSIYVMYLCETDWKKDTVILQEGETIDYKWISRDELLAMTDDELISRRAMKLLQEQNI